MCLTEQLEVDQNMLTLNIALVGGSFVAIVGQAVKGLCIFLHNKASDELSWRSTKRMCHASQIIKIFNFSINVQFLSKISNLPSI